MLEYIYEKKGEKMVGWSKVEYNVRNIWCEI